MSAGYSTEFVHRVRQASRTLIGVRLARYCIKHGIPASVIAERFGVSRTTVYKWFKGDSSPVPALQARVARFIGE